MSQLKVLLMLLVCPSTALHAFIEGGTLPAHTVGRGVLGRCIISLIDAACADGGSANADEGGACGSGSGGGNGGSSGSDGGSGGDAQARRVEQLMQWRAALCRGYGLPDDGPSSAACWTHTLIRAWSLPPSMPLCDETDVPGTARRASGAIGAAAALPLHVEAGFLRAVNVAAVRDAASAHVSAHRMAAGVGPSQAVDTSVRVCDGADLLGACVWRTLHPTLCELVRLIDQLRVELAAASGRPLLDVAELQILRYPPGGYYRRHLDVGAPRVVRRAVSLLLYLTPDDWGTADGGQLRVWRPGAADDADAALEVAPSAGTLVLFESAQLPHAVSTCRRERLVMVGWLCEQDN